MVWNGIQISKSHKRVPKETFQIFLYFVGLAACLFISAVIQRATKLICTSFDARIVLEQLRYIPVNPKKQLLQIVTGFIIILCFEIMFLLKKDLTGHNSLKTVILLIYILIVVRLFFAVDVSYKEILLLPATHIVAAESKYSKRLLLPLLVILYIILDQSFISTSIRLVTLDNYISYYPSAIQMQLFAGQAIFRTLSQLLFLAYVMLYVHNQVTEKKHIQDLNTALNNRVRQLQVLNVQISEYAKKSEDMAKLKERNRLAREIHDTIGHVLTGINLGLKACLCMPQDRIGEIYGQLGKIQDLAQKGTNEVRTSLKELLPDALERYSLIPALELLVERMNGCTMTHSYLTIEENLPSLNATQEELVYRIVQESMTNAVGHGNATEIEIRIDTDRQSLFISICDNGDGTDNLQEGFGLTNIKNRVAAFNGTTKIITAAGKGFGLHISIPLLRS